MKDGAFSFQDAMKIVNQNFHEENTTNNILGTRDTSCIFENLRISEDSATMHAAMHAAWMGEKEEFVPSFVSLVVSSTVGSSWSLWLQ
jgi:hypothetical protein